MQTLKSIGELRNLVREWRQAGETVGLVPTMGNLHDGHLQLVNEACNHCSRVIVSIFVNPTQFSQGGDFDAYPRTLRQDSQLVNNKSVDCLFIPDVSEIYSQPNYTSVDVSDLSNVLCGKYRPGHFKGVTTIVCKLFNIVQPDIAVFGEKDFQQLVVIRQMVRDLNIPVEILGIETVREKDGLAMSSRNVYLTPTQRKLAPLIFQVLSDTIHVISEGMRDFRKLEVEKMELLQKAGFKPEYFSIRRTLDLGPAQPKDIYLVILTAAWLGKARLIDNLKLNISSSKR